MHLSTKKYADKSIRNMIFLLHKYSLVFVDKSKIKRKKSFRASYSVELVFLPCLLLEGKFSGDDVANDWMILVIMVMTERLFFQFNWQLQAQGSGSEVGETSQHQGPLPLQELGSRSLRHQGGEHPVGLHWRRWQLNWVDDYEDNGDGVNMMKCW